MACKTKEGEELLLLDLRLSEKGQCRLYLHLAPTVGGMTMSIHHVDELIGELITLRDAMERENARSNQ